jgi:glycosyltransferase involved in cell wall biosynthesis
MDVSVIVTCYNEEDYIGDAIESVLAQTAFDAVSEVLVVDDGSSDGSAEVIGSYADAHPKVQYIIHQQNQGLPVTRNTGIRNSTGAYIAFLDGDDLWLKHKLGRQLAVVETYPDVGIVYGDTYRFGQKKKQRRVYANHYDYEDENTLERFFASGGPIVPSTALVNKKCFQSEGFFDPELRRAQDTDMWLRIVRAYPIQHIREPLAKRRIREGSLGANHEKKSKFLWQVIEKAVERDPELRRLRHKRDAKIRTGRARSCLRGGRRGKAIRAAFQAFLCHPTAQEVYVTLVLVFLPLQNERRQILLEMLQDVREWIREGGW